MKVTGWEVVVALAFLLGIGVKAAYDHIRYEYKDPEDTTIYEGRASDTKGDV